MNVLANAVSLTCFLHQRTTRVSVQKQCQLTRDIINRLKVSAELQGHRGCVNCIEFNDTGR